MKQETKCEFFSKKVEIYIQEDDRKQRMIPKWLYQHTVDELLSLIQEVGEFAESIRKEQEKYLAFDQLQKR